MNKNQSGKNNSMFGRRRFGKDNPMFGKKHSEKTKKLISDAHTKDEKDKIHNMHICSYCGKVFENKRKKAIYCNKRCSELGSIKPIKFCIVCGKSLKRRSRNCCSKKCLGENQRIYPKAKCIICGKDCKYHYSKTCSYECDRRLRRLRRIEEVKKTLAAGNKVSPFYNEIACKWFEKFDKENNTSGQHANTKAGEAFVRGYWLDYINHDKKLIIEWNEKQHYNKNGSLKTKDERKKKEITEEFPDYEYWIIKEDTMQIDKNTR